ncbi:non-ribosomal peptide synthetase, partial [Methylogaea oryzae]|uniref:non-ribosomal peptide synthetase n=1 Tax=Methylogaea oryzae TaxID=1295382 RepID=UPI000A5DE1F5
SPSRYARLRGASVALRLDGAESKALRALAKEQGVTLFTLLLATYKTLLHRYTHQDDIIVGVPTSGRGQARFAPVVGNMVNPLPLRTRPKPGQTFADYLAQVRDAWLEAAEHQDYPFSLLVERLQPERGDGRWPIYQTLFVLQQAQSGVEEGFAQLALGESGAPRLWGEWSVMPIAVHPRVENFDLKLMAADCADGLLFSFQYRSDLFDEASVARLAGHYRRLLRGIAAAPGQRLGELPLLTEEERRDLAGWNATRVDYPAGRCLHQLFEDQAGKTPDAEALVFEDRRLSYRQLNERANRLARSLLERGVEPGSAVGIGAQRSLELVVGLLGILKAGCAYVPLAPDYPAERLAAMAEDAGVGLILTQPRFIDRYVWFDGAVAALAADPAGDGSANPDLAVADDALAYVLFTSGSTGRPKGVAIPHGGICNRLRWMQDYFGLEPGEAVLQKTPYTFDVSVWEFFWPLLAGSRLILAGPDDHKDPDRLIDLIERHGVTTVHFVPSMLDAFLAAPDLARCGALRRVICSGEAVSVALQKRFFRHLGARFFNLYGPTEASVDVTAWECSPDGDVLSVPIGRPVANTAIHLLDEGLNRCRWALPANCTSAARSSLGAISTGRS